MSVEDLGNDPINFYAELDVRCNELRALGEATMQYLPDENIVTARMQYDNASRGGASRCAAPSSSSSHASIFCSLFTPGLSGAVRLIELFGDRVSATADFRIHDLSGEAREDPYSQSLLGLITQEATLERIDTREYRMQTTLNGWLNRLPALDDIRSPGYSVYFRQVGPGEIEGIYGQELSDSQGHKQYSFCRRTYRYEGTRRLPSDQVMVYSILDFAERFNESESGEGETHVIEFRSQSYNVPVEYQQLRT